MREQNINERDRANESQQIVQSLEGRETPAVLGYCPRWAGASFSHGHPKVSGPYSLYFYLYTPCKVEKNFHFCLELRLGTFNTEASLEGRLKSQCSS